MSFERLRMPLCLLIRNCDSQAKCHFYRDFCHTVPACIDTNVCLHVSASPLFIQLAKLVLILEQRSLSRLWSATVHQVFRLGIKEHYRDQRSANQCHVGRLCKGAPSQRNHRRLRADFGDQRIQRRSFFPTKAGLAILTKDLRHAPSIGCHDPVVEVDKPPAQIVCQSLARRGLARAHESDEEAGVGRRL